MRIGDIIRAEFTDTSILGAGVARVDDMAVFCPAAVAGDVAEIEIIAYPPIAVCLPSAAADPSVISPTKRRQQRKRNPSTVLSVALEISCGIPSSRVPRIATATRRFFTWIPLTGPAIMPPPLTDSVIQSRGDAVFCRPCLTGSHSGPRPFCKEKPSDFPSVLWESAKVQRAASPPFCTQKVLMHPYVVPPECGRMKSVGNFPGRWVCSSASVCRRSGVCDMNC